MKIVVTLKNLGGQLPLTFTVEGTDYVVPAGSSVPVTISGLADGTHTIAIHQGELDLSTVVTVACDRPGQGSVASAVTCANADGVVTVSLVATGGELPVTFTVMGVQYTVQPDTTQNVVLSGLADGTQHISVFVGDTDLSFNISMVCDVQVSPPAPTPVPGTAADTLVVLPATGPANVTPLLVIAFGSVLLGGALLVFKRRLGVR